MQTLTLRVKVVSKDGSIQEYERLKDKMYTDAGLLLVDQAGQIVASLPLDLIDYVETRFE